MQPDRAFQSWVPARKRVMCPRLSRRGGGPEQRCQHIVHGRPAAHSECGCPTCEMGARLFARRVESEKKVAVSKGAETGYVSVDLMV